MKASRGIGVALATGGMLVGGGIAYAAIPSTDGVIHGCYSTSGTVLGPSKGTLRVVDEGERCRSNERALPWSQTGPQGPQGPQGPAGVLGYTYLESPRTTATEQADGNWSVELVLTCPDGKHATGGGYRVVQFQGGLPELALVHTNSPTVFDGGGPRNWQVNAIADREFIAIGYVMCAAS